MEEDNEDPSEVNSFHFSEARTLDLNKKRKLQATELGLPLPKHKCWEHRLPLEPRSQIESNEEVHLITHIIKGDTKRRAIEESLDPESGKGSNSFVGDSDSAISVYGEGELNTEISNIGQCERPSSSSINRSGCYHSKDDHQSSADNALMTIRGDEEGMTSVGVEHEVEHHCNGLQMYQNLVEPLGDRFGSHLEHGEYEDSAIEPYTDKELDDILYSNGENPNVYVLSSGPWSVNKDAESGTRKPTIDKEFEQFFSMLML